MIKVPHGLPASTVWMLTTSLRTSTQGEDRPTVTELAVTMFLWHEVKTGLELMKAAQTHHLSVAMMRQTIRDRYSNSCPGHEGSSRNRKQTKIRPLPLQFPHYGVYVSISYYYVPHQHPDSVSSSSSRQQQQQQHETCQFQRLVRNLSSMIWKISNRTQTV